MRLNLNKTVKVKLTERGKEIYRQYFSPLPDGFEQPEPRIDEDGFTKIQLWVFMEMFGEHMSVWQPNVIKPLEIVFDNEEEIVHCKDCMWRECDWEELYCSHNDAMVNITDDCYCSYGERKLNNPDDSLVREDSEACKEQKSKLDTDLISRQAAIEAMWKALYTYEDLTEKQFMEHEELELKDWFQHRIFVQRMHEECMKSIESLPPVEPKPVYEDAISRQDAIEAIEGVDWYHVNSNGELVHGSTSDEESWYKAEDIYKAIESLPPVNQKQVTSKLESAEIATLEGEESTMNQLKSKLDCISKHDLWRIIEDNAYWVTYNETSKEKGMTLTGINQALNECPPVTPTERTGEWVDRNDEGVWNYCSVCGEQSIDLFDFCPNCGAKMKG